MATRAHVSRVRALYKRILVLHRFLPLDLRALGDRYVKDEFRRHRGAGEGEVEKFMTEWESYRNTLQTQVLESSAGAGRGGSLQVGVHMSEQQLHHLQDEQVGQLYELLLETRKPNYQFHLQEDGSS